MIGRAALLWGLLVAPVSAHDWYPKDCCGERDCRPVSCAEIDISSDGAVSWHGRVVPKMREGQYHKFPGVWPSPDGKCHVCPTGYEAMCVFIPQKLASRPVPYCVEHGYGNCSCPKGWRFDADSENCL